MVKSALRIIDILEFVSSRRGGCTHGEVAAGVAMPKSSTTALMRDLVGRGYLVFDAISGRYRLGPKVVEMASIYLRTLDVVATGQDVVREIFAALDEFSALAIPQGLEMVNVCAETPHHPGAHTLQVGERLPLHATASGKAWLAFLPAPARESILARIDLRVLASKTIRDRMILEAELALVREKGIAWHLNEHIEGIVAIAVCIFDAIGHPVAALSVAVPAVRFDAILEARVIAALTEGGDKLSQRLGYRRPG